MSLRSLPLESKSDIGNMPGRPVFPVGGVGSGVYEEGRCQWRGLVSIIAGMEGAISQNNDQYSTMMLFNQTGEAWVFSPLGSRHSGLSPTP